MRERTERKAPRDTSCIYTGNSSSIIPRRKKTKTPKIFASRSASPWFGLRQKSWTETRTSGSELTWKCFFGPLRHATCQVHAGSAWEHPERHIADAESRSQSVSKQPLGIAGGRERNSVHKACIKSGKTSPAYPSPRQVGVPWTIQACNDRSFARLDQDGYPDVGIAFWTKAGRGRHAAAIAQAGACSIVHMRWRRGLKRILIPVRRLSFHSRFHILSRGLPHFHSFLHFGAGLSFTVA